MNAQTLSEQAFEAEPDLASLRVAYSKLQSDPIGAIQEFKTLADRGSVMSMVYLGDAFANGTGSHADLEEAEKWFLRASATGSVEGTFHLGAFYFDRKEYSKAEHVFDSNGLKDYPPAMDRLAWIYIETKQPEKIERARRLLERASALGHIYAKRHLAGLMMRGKLGLSAVLPGVRLFFAAVLDGLRVGFRDPLSERLR